MRLSCKAARFSLWKGEMTLFFLDTEAPLSIGEQLVGKLRELWQGLMQNGGNILWNLLVTAVILLIAKFALQAVSSFTGRAIQKGNLRLSEPQKKRSDTMMTLLRSASRYLIYFVALLLILRQFGFGQTINNLLVTAGIGSLAIGFGAQNLVKDLVTGFFIMFENQFSVGDYVKIDDVEGTVEATAIRVTYLRSLKGDQIIIPNGSISRVINYTRGCYSASITVSTAYEADTRAAMEIIDRAVKRYGEEHGELLEDMPSVTGVTALGESSVEIGVFCKVKPLQQWAVERGMRLAVKEEFDRLGESFPYPHLVVIPGKPEKASDS